MDANASGRREVIFIASTVGGAARRAVDSAFWGASLGDARERGREREREQEQEQESDKDKA